MYRNRIFFFIPLFLFLFASPAFGQGQRQEFQEITLSKQDSIIASSIPELKLPENYKSGSRSELPSELNNAELPYFRPIFSQEGSSCGQASGIGYNFTYEMNCARDLPANDSTNQYPTHFAWNFMNGGNGWHGVSYFHSFDLLKACGSPSVATYGGWMNPWGERWWMSGYDNYYSALQNRIEDVFYIDIHTPEGLLTLKHWLNDHLNGSEFGGVASFYASSPWNSQTLPPESPEAGKHIITNWLWPASHAMTIVGYNDSIRFDWNQDGQFTNNIDINGDGLVDMKDWENGALIFANSYGKSWLDSGFCYMMYKTLADDFGDGGIWNSAVHVLTINESYEPLLTIRVKLKNNSREKIKILVGVTADTVLFTPSFSMDFPLLNFQGGNYPLQSLEGIDTLALEMMEIELDATPLLGHIEAGKSAKFFFQVVENDPKNQALGEVLHFSLIDRTDGGAIELSSTETPLPIANNSITSLSLISTVSFNKPEIITEELPAYSGEENYLTTLEAEGGQTPYNWTLLKPYSLNAIQKDFPEIQGEQLPFYDQEHGHITFNMAFPFPYYGDTVHQISVAIDGLVSFEDENFAYPYYFGESTLLTDRKVIAPFMANLLINPDKDNGVWVENTSEYFGVFWKASYNRYNVIFDGDFNFSLRLFPDGRIETYYGDFDIPSYVNWVSGISMGDESNYTVNSFNQHLQNPGGTVFEYIPAQLPEDIKITSAGDLSISGADEGMIFNISTGVKDNNGVVDTKTFQLSTALIINYEISSGADEQIDYFDTASLKFFVKNISNETIEQIDLQSLIENEDIVILKSGAHFGDLAPGETKTIDSALVFKVSATIPDQYNFRLSNQLSSHEKSWDSEVCLKAAALQLKLAEIVVDDGNNSFLEPGETADLQIEIQNLGHSSGEDLDIRIVSNSDYLIVNTPSQHTDYLPVGSKITLNYNVTTRSWTPSGYTIPSQLKLSIHGEIIRTLSMPITIGKIPVLILNLEEQSYSADHFRSIFDSLKLQYEYSNAFPANLMDYQSIFVCLGDKYNSYELSLTEGNKLNSFLEEGGKIYMEGMNTWIEDETSPVHNKFNADFVSDGSYFPFSHVFGVDGQLTEGLIMDYGGSMPYNNHYLLPVGTAFPFLRTSPSDTACAIANEDSGYKTIGSSVLFGHMTNPDSLFTTTKYVNAILEFFEIEIQVVNVPEVYPTGETLSFELFPNPFFEHLTIQFFSPDEANLRIEIFDINGRLILRKELQRVQANQSIKIHWDGKDKDGKQQSPGIYFIRYNSGEQSVTRKVVMR